MKTLRPQSRTILFTVTCVALLLAALRWGGATSSAQQSSFVGDYDRDNFASPNGYVVDPRDPDSATAEEEQTYFVGGERLADGSVVAGGRLIGGGQGDFWLRKYTPSGAVDTSFGTNGSVRTNFYTGGNGELSNDIPSVLRVQPDGKILIAGICDVAAPSNEPYFGGGFCLMRFNANGSVDTTFGNNTVTTGNMNSQTYPFQIGEGRVLTETAYFDSGNRGGTTFGRVTLADMTIQPDGKIIVVGETTDFVNPSFQGAYTERRVGVIVRYNTNGSLDSTFGSNADTRVSGVAKFIGANTSSDPNAYPGCWTQRGFRGVALQPDGRIIAVGYDGTSDANCSQGKVFVVTRWTPDGQLETVRRLDNNTSVSAREIAYAALLTSDGKVLVSGAYQKNSIIRLNLNDLSLDTTFGTGGIQQYGDAVNGEVGSPLTIKAIQPDGKILGIHTYFGDGTGVVRFNFDGTTDQTFGNAGAFGADQRGRLSLAATFPQCGDQIFNGSHLILRPDGKLNIFGNVGCSQFTGPRAVVSQNTNNIPNTLPGSNVTVESPSGEARVTFSQVTQPGDTTFTQTDPSTAGTLPSGYTLTSSSFARDITTTATFTGNAEVCFSVTGVTDAAELDRLHLLHGENGVLVDRTSSRDFATKNVCATVTSFSPFVVAKQLDTSSISNVSGGGIFGGTATLTATLTVGNTSLSGKTVSFTLNSASAGTATTDANGVATLTGVSLSGTDAGTYANAVGASFAGDADNASSSGAGTLTVNKATATITLGSLTQTYDGTEKSATATTDPAGKTVVITYSQNNQALASPTNAGSYGVTATINDADYQGSTTGTLTINKAGSTTTVTIANATFDGQPHGGTATVTGAGGLSQSLTVSYSGRNTTTYGPAATVPTGVGDYTASASFGGDSNHTASSDSKDFQIGKASQTVTFAALPNKTFGDPDFAVSASASSGLSVTFAASDACTVSGSNVHLTGAGSCTITASQPGNANYDAAANVPQSFQIAKAATATTLSSSMNPANAGQSVTFTATVISPAGTPTGTVTFKDGGSVISTCATVSLSSGQAACTTGGLTVGSHTITADYSGDSNFNLSTGALQGGQTVAGGFEFSQSTYTVSERDGSITITVRRTGDTSQAASVDYATDDGSIPSVAAPCSSVTGVALERCDYTRAAGTLQFTAGDMQKTFTVLVNDDSYAEGTETTSLRLSNPVGATLGRQSSATLQITDDAQQATNPVDDPQPFVRQHYHDFLNREPDPSGLQFWTNQMTNCGASDPLVCRVNVSAAFFLSIEFQQTGYLVERMYKASFGDATGNSALAGAHQLSVPVVHLQEFIADTQEVESKPAQVIVGQGNWQQQLEDNKNAFALEFVGRARFTAAFPPAMTADTFVNQLNTNAGGVLTPSDIAQLDSVFGGPSASSADAAKRAQVLRQVAENASLQQRESNRAFVLMQYFGYLRRNPDEAPDADYTGYDFWLSKLNNFNGNFVRAEMVKAFIQSSEYRQRFGQ